MTVITKQADRFILSYDLFSLPTAQHKAGLAGLLLMIDSLRERKIEPLPSVEGISPTEVRVSLTQSALQSVFDDLYDSERVEVPVKVKWPGKEPKRTDEVVVEIDGKSKREKRFVYDAVSPRGAFLQIYFPDGNGLWVKLWRDMLWSTLRGIPKTRLVYEERADSKPSSLAAGYWSTLEKALAQQNKGNILTESLSSSLFVGAEDANAERVSFKGPAADNFLLHFWPIVSLIHVPRTWSIERLKEQGFRIARKEAGFVLSIPEPANLEQFCEDARDVLRSLDPQSGGIRPRSALIDLHEEGGLEYLYHFAHLRTSAHHDYVFSLCALEIFHLQKQGNRIRQLAVERILPRREVLSDYELLRKKIWNPVFKAVVLRNLVAGKPWHAHFDQPFHQHPMPLFIRCQGRTPREITFFGMDVRRKFASIESQLKNDKAGGVMDEQTRDNQLSMRVYRLIQTYVNHRTEEKSGKKYKDFSKHKDAEGHIQYPNEYREAREKVCTDAFLAMRGRRDQEFVEYFTGTICSVPQYLNQEEYVSVAGALTSDWERIKILSMLALSAQSYLPGNIETQEVE